MYEDNMFLHTEDKECIHELKSKDRGYGVIKTQFLSDDGFLKVKKIPVYTSGCIDSNIRDAVSGEYYKSKVGSSDEDYFFKVSISSGKLKTINGSTTLFFISPGEFERHLNIQISKDIIHKWEEKKRLFLLSK